MTRSRRPGRCLSLFGLLLLSQAEGKKESWMIQFGTELNDIVTGIDVDIDGGVYICGKSDGAWVAAFRSIDGSNIWYEMLGLRETVSGLGVLPEGKLALAGSIHPEFGWSVVSHWRRTLDKLTGRSIIPLFSLGTVPEVNHTVESLVTSGMHVYVGGTTFSDEHAFLSADNIPRTSGGHGDAWIGRYDKIKSPDPFWTAQEIASGHADTLAGLAANEKTLAAAGSTFGNLPGAGQHLGEGDAWAAAINIETGSLRWSHTIGTRLGDEAAAIAVDAYGNVIVAGSSFGDVLENGIKPGGADVFIAKLSHKDGSRIWTQVLGSDRADRAHAIALDSSRVYVGGKTYGDFRASAAGKSDAWLAVLDLKNGNIIDAVQFGHEKRDSLDHLALLPSGDLIAAGTTDGHYANCNAGRKDIWIARIPPGKKATSFLAAYNQERHAKQDCSPSATVSSSEESTQAKVEEQTDIKNERKDEL